MMNRGSGMRTLKRLGLDRKSTQTRPAVPPLPSQPAPSPFAGKIVLAVCDGGRYEKIVKPTLDVGGIDDLIVVRDQPSIFVGYNKLFELAREIPDLGALVVIHDDVQLRGPLRPCLGYLNDPTVGIIGTVGGVDLKGAGWWTGRVRYGQYFDSNNSRCVFLGGTGNCVDAVDGLIMVFSPWVVHNLRFDDVTYSGWDMYDSDMCFVVRQAGKTVRVAPFNVYHVGRPGESIRPEFAINANKFRKKWTIA